VIAVGDVVRVKGFHGVACRYRGPETAYDYEADDEVETGWHLVVMIGDDHKHRVDYDDMSPLAEDAYCDGCGQIGCGHGSQRDA
jgi:hypothetical protein